METIESKTNKYMGKETKAKTIFNKTQLSSFWLTQLRQLNNGDKALCANFLQHPMCYILMQEPAFPLSQLLTMGTRCFVFFSCCKWHSFWLIDLHINPVAWLLPPSFSDTPQGWLMLTNALLMLNDPEWYWLICWLILSDTDWYAYWCWLLLTERPAQQPSREQISS